MLHIVHLKEGYMLICSHSFKMCAQTVSIEKKKVLVCWWYCYVVRVGSQNVPLCSHS